MKDKLINHFKDICKIPRGTYNIENISNYLVEFAKKNNLEYIQDESYNVMIIKKSNEKYKNSPIVILQSHMDMVCEKEKNSNHDFYKDEIKVIEEDGFLKALDTTLGADDGIGMSMMLSLLDSDIELGEVRCIFTVNEEKGMDGAFALDKTWLENAKYFINLDSEDEGILTLGCAGGASIQITFPIERIKSTGKQLEININNLKGGHSGVDINKNRVNAITFISQYFNNKNYDLIDINGGVVDNAIPNNINIKLLIKDNINIDELKIDIINKLNELDENNINIDINLDNNIDNYNIIKNSNNYLNYISNIPNGVIYYEEDLDNVPETSINLGIVNINNNMIIHHLIRSSKKTNQDKLINILKEECNKYNGILEITNSFPGWEYRKDSSLEVITEEVYKDLYNKDIIKEVIHAGLECGIIQNKNPNIECISIGPNIYDVHTTKEKVEIESVVRTYNFLLEILNKIYK